MGMMTQMVRVRAGNQLHLLLPLRWAHCPVRELQWAGSAACQTSLTRHLLSLLVCSVPPNSQTFLAIALFWAISWYLAPEKVNSVVVCRVCPGCCSILWVWKWKYSCWSDECVCLVLHCLRALLGTRRCRASSKKSCNQQLLCLRIVGCLRARSFLPAPHLEVTF